MSAGSSGHGTQVSASRKRIVRLDGTEALSVGADSENKHDCFLFQVSSGDEQTTQPSPCRIEREKCAAAQRTLTGGEGWTG